MQTPTHLLVAAAVLAKQGATRRNGALIAGALLPDLSIYALFAWSKIAGIAERRVWDVIYWQEPWQTLSAISNSVPLWSVLLVAGLLLARHTRAGQLIVVLAIAGLLHLALDFPFHHDDAHKHFWPLTDWRFASPLSYWDPTHYGRWVAAAWGGAMATARGALGARAAERPANPLSRRASVFPVGARMRDGS